MRKYDVVVPLDRIQDVTVSQDCLQKCFGVNVISIHTAGGSGFNGQPEAVLLAPKHPQEVRDVILAKRDALALGKQSLPTNVTSGGLEEIIQSAPLQQPQETSQMVVTKSQ
jgi:uncharacterized membrane protein YdbT with pleckstrin-like domain